MKKVYYAIISLILVLVLTGCTSTGNNVTSDHGTLTLSINPEIAINYNQDGEVLGVVGINTDGKSIVANYQDYIGKDVNTVVNELIVDINEAGYFLEDIDGNKRNIVIKIEPNSVLPSETFTSDLNTSISNTLSSLSQNASKTIVAELDAKMQTTIKHKDLNKTVSYQYLMRLECYKLVKHLLGEKVYESFKIWW